MNKLVIDTTDNKSTSITLFSGNKTDTVSEDNVPKSQTALLLVEKLLRKHNISPKELDEIEVNTGPGSFTGTRVGVSIANSLGFGLSIKVNGKKGKQVQPKYF
jgi:tRNA threonylcarbamoyladenosine biosynthesis protein TsaB